MLISSFFTPGSSKVITKSSFVSRIVNDALRACNLDAAFTLIALERENRPHYSLFLETDTPLPDKMATLVDRGLRENVHYDLCRRLGQLGPVETVSLSSGSFARYTERLTARGVRLGDINPEELFRPYVRGSKSTGAGLGLSLVWRVCEHQDWKIKLGNRPGGGAFAELTLSPSAA